MATMTEDRRTVKPSRKAPAAKPTDTFTCCVSINHTCYNVTPITGIEHPDVLRAFRIENLSNHEVYDVAGWVAGPVECTCPNYEMKLRGNGLGLCKHGRALVALGLLDAPLAPPRVRDIAPVPAPVVVPEPTPTPAEKAATHAAIVATCERANPYTVRLTPEAREAGRKASAAVRADASHPARPFEPSDQDRAEHARWYAAFERQSLNRSSRSAVVSNFRDEDAVLCRGYA